MSSSGVAAPVVVSYTKTGIDGLVAAATTVFTTENGTRRFHPTFLIFEGTDISGFVSVSVASIGTNAVTYNNILLATALTGLNANFLVYSQPLSAIYTSVAPNTDIKVNVSVISVGTTYTFKVTILGYYE